jgi:MSHA biogenesis protein MshJ
VKPFLKRIAERVDAATLRERLMIFLALTVVLVFAANLIVLEPLRAKQKRFAAETAQRQKELAAVQAEVQRMARSVQVDPDAPVRTRQRVLREELAELDRRVALEQRRFTPPERMRAALQEMLQRNRRVALLDLRSLAVAPIGPEKPAGSGALYRHGMELTLSGTYIDLYEYLQALEGLPTQLYWRRAEFAVTEHPLATLKLTVYTVSFDRTWLTV